MKRYDYTIFPNNSKAHFEEACSKIEKAYPNIKKEKLLIDVDGSTIQTYTENNFDIDVYDDYDIGAVFIKSDVNLDTIFS